MSVKQKVKLQSRSPSKVYTESNAQFSNLTEDSLCARFNTSYTREDSPSSPAKTQYTEHIPYEDGLLAHRINSEQVEDRLRQLSSRLYEKGVIKNKDLMDTISSNKIVSSRRLSQNSVQDNYKVIENMKVEDKKRKYSPTTVIQKVNKENKKTDFSPNKSPIRVSKKIITEKSAKERVPVLENKRVSISKPVPNSTTKQIDNRNKSPIQSVTNHKTKSPVERKSSLASPINQKNKTPGHYRKGSMPSGDAVNAEIVVQKWEPRERQVPSLSPREILKSKRASQESKQSSSFVKQEGKKGQKKEDDIIVKVNIQCYSPTRNAAAIKEKAPESQDELIKTLKMVKKFIDKSLGDDAKLKKLTELLSRPSQPV